MSSPTRLDFYDLELRAHHRRLRAAYGIDRGDHVLDIGCGTGLTSRDAGRAAAPGAVLGVDVSERMLERARELTARERLENVSYELGDAQVCRFDPKRFDVAISRFGTMFFSDPVAAFANIAAALVDHGPTTLAPAHARGQIADRRYGSHPLSSAWWTEYDARVATFS